MIRKAHKVLVASTNPVKIEACRRAFNKVFPDIVFEFSGIGVASGVADQPMDIEETFAGARNRVNALVKLGEKASYFVGMEGGLNIFKNEYFAFAWMYIRSDDGFEGKSQTAHFQLPPPVVQLLKEGYELGDADDVVFGKSNSKQNSGAIGLLTGDLINRSKYYEHAMIQALVPFKNSELFEQGKG